MNSRILILLSGCLLMTIAAKAQSQYITTFNTVAGKRYKLAIAN